MYLWTQAKDPEGKASPDGSEATLPRQAMSTVQSQQVPLCLTPVRWLTWPALPTCRYTPTFVPHFPYINLEGFFGTLGIVFETPVGCLPDAGLTEINPFLLSQPPVCALSPRITCSGVFLVQCFFHLASCFWGLSRPTSCWPLSNRCSALIGNPTVLCSECPWLPISQLMISSHFKRQNTFCQWDLPFSHRRIPISRFTYYICPHKLCMLSSYPMEESSLSKIISSPCALDPIFSWLFASPLSLLSTGPFSLASILMHAALVCAFSLMCRAPRTDPWQSSELALLVRSPVPWI